MNVRTHAGTIGFTQIFTSEKPNTKPGRIAPKKQPYIVFEMQPADETYCKALEERGLSLLGKTTARGNTAILTITSARKVEHAIEIFTNFSEYQTPENAELFENLRAYQQKCQAIQAGKQPKSIPLKSSLASKFQKDLVDPTVAALPASRNTTHRVTKLSSGKKYIYKENKSGRAISEIEAFNAFSYRVLLGEQHPKVKGVHDAAGNRAGVTSEIVPLFMTLHEYVAAYGALSKQQLVDSKIVKVWVASYSEEEGDLHNQNCGLVINGPNGAIFCIKIDDDQATWSLVSKYFGLEPEDIPSDPSYQTAPISAFPVTARDITSFPKLQDANPHQWFDRRENERAFNMEAVTEAMNDPKFIYDKYNGFLKRILIPNSVYEAIGLATISSPKTRQKLVAHKCKKTASLKEVLINTAEFQDFIISNPQAINEIKAEFVKYNAGYPKEKDAYLRIDLAAVDTEFKKIKQQAYRIKHAPTFWDRNAALKNILIGTAIGLAVIGAIALTILTAGGGGVALVGMGTAVGGAMGLSGVAAIAVGLTAISAACVITFSTIAALVGKVVQPFSKPKNEAVRAAPNVRVGNPILNQIREPATQQANTPSPISQSPLVPALPPLAHVSFFVSKNPSKPSQFSSLIGVIENNINFLQAPFDVENKTTFTKWLGQDKAAHDFYKELVKALTYEGKNYISEYKDAVTGSLKTFEDKMKVLLQTNIQFYTFLKENRNKLIRLDASYKSYVARIENKPQQKPR